MSHRALLPLSGYNKTARTYKCFAHMRPCQECQTALLKSERFIYVWASGHVSMIEDKVGNTGGRYAPYKSWGEYRIGSLLDKYGLPFIYEKPTAVLDSGKVRLWYPDFSLSYGMLIEYFGIAGNSEYNKRTEHKLAVYRQNQMDCLPVYPRDMNNGWEQRILSRIDHTLDHRLSSYRSNVGKGYLGGGSRGRTGYR